MKKFFSTMAVAAGLLVATGSVQAVDDGLGIGVGVRASTLGAGIELGKSLNNNFSVRLGVNDYSRSETQSIDNIDYSADLELSSTALMLDWHPFGGSFHLTAGYVDSGNELRGRATPVGPVDIGGLIYTPTTFGELVLDVGVDMGSGPYLGFGWGNVPASGFGFVFEVGVVDMGTPDVSLVPSGPLGVLIPPIVLSQEIANIQDDLNEFDIYPVVALGISYGF